MNVTNKLAVLLTLFLTLGITTATAASVSPANQDGVTTPEYTAAGETTEYELAVTLSGMESESFTDILKFTVPSEMDGFSSDDVEYSGSADVVLKDSDGDGDNDRINLLSDNFADGDITLNLTTNSIESEGSYTIDADVTDNAIGDTGSTTLTTRVDDTRPSSEAQINSPEEDPKDSQSNWGIEADGISDSGDVTSRVAEVALMVKAPESNEYVEHNTDEDPGDSATFDFTPESGDGVYKFRSVAVDVVDNDESVSGADDSITLDTQSPEQVSGLQHEDSDANSGFDNDGDVKFTWDEAEDNGQAGIDRYEVRYSTDGGDLDQSDEVEAGTTEYTVTAENGDQVQVEVWAVDNAGNPGSRTTSDEIIVDKEKPGNPTSVSVSTSPINRNNDEKVDATVKLPDDHESGTVEIRFGGSSEFTFEETVSESGSDGQGHQVSFTGLDISDLADSETLSVDARFVDDAGNVNPDGFTQGITVVKDTKKPSPSISFSATPVDEEDLTQEVTVDFGEAMDTAVKPQVSIDVGATSQDDGSWSNDGTTWTETFDVSDNDEEVTASATVRGAEDDAGNLQVEDGSANVADFSVDTKVSIDSVQHSFDGSDNQYTVTVEAGESLDANTISVDVDGESEDIVTLSGSDFTESGSSGNTYTATDSVDEDVEDQYTATLTAAQDNNGNTLTSDRSTDTSIEIDTNPPTVTEEEISTEITTDDLKKGVANPGDVITVEWDDSSSGDDNPDVESVTMDLSAFGCKSSKTASDADEDEVWTADCTVEEDAEGGIDSTGLQASVTAKDNVGNSETTTDGATISVDNTVPAEVSSLGADRFADSDGAGIELNWDSVTEVDQYKVERKQGKDWTEIKSVSSTSYQDYDVSNAEEYDYRVRAVDNAENKGEYSSTESEMADTEAPKVTSAETISTTEIEVTLSDDVSGLDVSTIEAGDFATSSGDVTDISGQDAEDEAGSTTFTVETGSFDRGETPIVSGDVEADGISDVTGNTRDGYTYGNTKDGVPPQKPEEVSFDSEEFINSDEASSAGITVDLPSEVEGGTVEVRVSDGNTEVSADTVISAEDSEASVSPDVSGLSEGQLDLEAWIIDDSSSKNEGEHLENTDAAELDTKAPTFESAEVVDKGSIDVIFKGDINGNTVSGDAFDIEDPYGVKDYDVDGETVELTLEEEPQTGATPEVTVNPDSVSDKGITDDAGNAVETETKEASDELSPEIQSVTTYDVEDGVGQGQTKAGEEGDGTVNGVIVEFTEQLQSVDSSELDFESHEVSEAELMEDSSKVGVELTEEIEGTGATPVLNLDPEAVQDDSGNNLETAKSIRSSDGASPVLMSSEVNQDVSDSDSTVLDLRFSEFVKASPDASATLGPAEGTLQFSEQTGTTLQATYHDSDVPAVLNTGEVYEETEGEETEMTEPEVEAFTGVEDVDHYREAGANGGANLEGYEAPSGCDSENTYSIVQEVEQNLAQDKLVCVDGELSSQLVIDEKGATVAATSQGVEIDLGGSSGPGVAIDTSETTLKGFKVANVGSNGDDGPSGQGIAVNGDQGDRLSGIELSYLEITGVYDRGLVVDHSDDVVVSNVYSHDNRGADWDNEGGSYVSDGVIFWDVTDSEMKHITAHDNGDNGVYVEGQNNRVVDVLSYDNGDQGIDLSHGHFDNDGGTTVVNVTSRGNAYEGIEVESTQDRLEITGAVLKNNARSLHFTSSNNEADLVIRESRISGKVVNDASQTVIANDNFFAQGWEEVEGNFEGDVDASYTTLNSAVNSQGTDIRTFTRTLSEGSNMVSFPIRQGRKPVSEVIEDGSEEDGLSDSNVETVWTYQNGQWRELATGYGDSEEEDYFRGGIGYIFHMTDSDTLSVNVNHEYQQEEDSTPESLELSSTWNLVGSYQEFDQSADDALSSLDSDYEAFNDELNCVEDMETGVGYWVTRTDNNGHTPSCS